MQATSDIDTGEEFELDAAGLELDGKRRQLGGVAGEALEFVDGEDAGRLGRGLLELSSLCHPSWLVRWSKHLCRSG